MKYTDLGCGDRISKCELCNIKFKDDDDIVADRDIYLVAHIVCYNKYIMKDMPKPLDNIDFKNIILHATNYIENLVEEDGCHHEDCDCKYFMFETVMTTVYGKDIFDWINKQE